MSENAVLQFRGKNYDLPVIVGSEDEVAIDIQKLRAATGLITLDDGYGNTGSCRSAITFIDGEKGILRYRGYPIEELAERSSFVESSYLVMFGELPTPRQLADFRACLSENEYLHEDMRHHFEGFPPNAHPMGILSAMINAANAFQPELAEPEDDAHFMESAARLISKVRTIAAAAYKKSVGQPMAYPRPDLPYVANFLHMMFSKPNKPYQPDWGIVRALDLILMLHADHEQNCSTSTVRMVASSGANLFASVASGVNALWGPLHGGANMAVIDMLKHIHADGDDGTRFIQAAKTGKGERLMGFGHRVYKHYDPRAAIIKKSFYKALAALGIKDDPLLSIAMKLEEVALSDDYFVSRKLYPNVDFYSGLIMRALGIPENMFTVMFAIGRMPGWVAHWHEVASTPKLKIHRPRQIYTGAPKRDFVPMNQRG